MSSTTERFLRLFEEMVGEVNTRAGDEESHSFLIERAASRDGAVKKHQGLLKYIRDVRNALQHPKHRSEGHAVLITEPFLEEVASLLNHLQNPVRSRSLGVPRKQIKTAQLSDCLGDLADDMKTRGFSHVPILDDSDVLIGVFNEAAVFAYLWSDDAVIIERSMRIEEILPHCRLDAQHTETFQFVGPNRQLEDVIDMFLALKSPTTRIGAVFVTASGKSTDKLQGMITPWDVLHGATS
ncbi:CBS domain-containing protein [Cucumibacter marinus]|uniref:CBS domain-containing protein n=1 Tax=Cucumibacter marinus TaxID=1121252 RepID=UPI00048CD1DE|nr:CBS domain-containing protein [Cucumibacter marinus]